MNMKIGTRIGGDMLHRHALAGMQRGQSELARVQEQISSGVRVSRAGEDPGAFATAQRIDTRLAQLEAHARGTVQARQRLSLAEVSIDDAAVAVDRVRELLLRAGSPALSADNREAIATELRQRLDEVRALANRTGVDGLPLFGGTAPAPAYAPDADGAWRYQGDDGQRLIAIAEHQSVADGDPGTSVFGPPGDDVFVHIEAALAALAEPDAEARNGAIGDALTALDRSLAGFDLARARLGARLSALDNADATRETEVLQLNRVRAQLVDTDVVEATTRMAQAAARLDATQLAYLRVQQPSLFSLLK